MLRHCHQELAWRVKERLAIVQWATGVMGDWGDGLI